MSHFFTRQIIPFRYAAKCKAPLRNRCSSARRQLETSSLNAELSWFVRLNHSVIPAATVGDDASHIRQFVTCAARHRTSGISTTQESEAKLTKKLPTETAKEEEETRVSIDERATNDVLEALDLGWPSTLSGTIL